MSVVAIFKNNIKNRHKRYIACDDVVEMAVILLNSLIIKNKISGSPKSVSFLGKGGTMK